MKKYLVGIFAVLLALSLFSCSASPTAIKVGNNKVDASEYAYYLNYNRLNLDALAAGTTVLNMDQLMEQARQAARQQIVSAEIVRIKCDELGLELTKEQKKEMKDEKDELIDSFGGLSGYLDYLRENALTDRLYDKLQENSYYYSMLHDYIAADPDIGVNNDQQLRQFFSENYTKVRYIRFSSLDEDGSLMDSDSLDALLEQAQEVLRQINDGELTFDQAGAEYGDGAGLEGTVIGTQDASQAEYVSDAFSLIDGQIGGVYTYSDGYYILQRQAVDISYFDENREQIELAASDWAFNSYISAAESNINVTESGVCQKIDFSNISDYIK